MHSIFLSLMRPVQVFRWLSLLFAFSCSPSVEKTFVDVSIPAPYTLPSLPHNDSIRCLTIFSLDLKVLYPIRYFRDPRKDREYSDHLTGFPETDYTKLFGDFNGDGIVDTCFFRLTDIPGKVMKEDDPPDEDYVQQTLSFSDPKIKHLNYPFDQNINLHLVGDIDNNGTDDLGILFYTGFSWAVFTILSYIENEWIELFHHIESQTLYRYSGIIPFEKDTINPGYVIVRYPASIPDSIVSFPGQFCRNPFCERVIETRLSVDPPIKPNND